MLDEVLEILFERNLSKICLLLTNKVKIFIINSRVFTKQVFYYKKKHGVEIMRFTMNCHDTQLQCKVSFS